MTKTSTAVAALAVLGLGASAANAADLASPIAPRVIAAEAVAIAGGIYLRGDVGIAYQTIESISWASTRNDPTVTGGERFFNSGTARNSRFTNFSALAGFGVGYAWTENFRTDATVEWRTASNWQSVIERPFLAGIGGASTNVIRGRTGSTVALLNAYYDIGTFWGLTPFVGAGIGAAMNFTDGFTDQNVGIAALSGVGGRGALLGNNSIGFAWALHAGVGYRVNEHLTLEASYRYLNMSNGMNSGITGCATPCPEPIYRANLGSHDFRLGARWTLAELNRSFGFGYQVAASSSATVGGSWSGGSTSWSGAGGTVVSGGQTWSSGGSTVVSGGQTWSGGGVAASGGTVVVPQGASASGGWVQQGGGWVPRR